MENGSSWPVQPGERAPDFSLPAIDREGTVSLSDYRGRSPLLLALFRGLYCPFCRKAIAGLGRSAPRLKERGVETLGVVATSPDNAKLYFRFRPTSLPLAADPELLTHRLFRLPHPPVTPEMMEALGELRINPTGDLPEPLPILEAAPALDRIEGFQRTAADDEDENRQFPLLKGQFLLDEEGIVRWANIECAGEGLAGLGKFPSAEELLRALEMLPA